MHRVSENIITSNPRGWSAIHVALIDAARQLAGGAYDYVAVAKTAVDAVHRRGFESLADERTTRFTGSRITRWQTSLYAVNELPDWRFPDSILLVGWLVECGGPAMGRGPAKSAFEERGVKLMIGGTRWRYNNQRYGHGGEDLPTSREYSWQDCPHTRQP